MSAARMVIVALLRHRGARLVPCAAVARQERAAGDRLYPRDARSVQAAPQRCPVGGST